MTYSIIDGFGDTISAGVQDLRAAKRIANEHAAKYSPAPRSSDRFARGVAVVVEAGEGATMREDEPVYRANPTEPDR